MTHDWVTNHFSLSLANVTLLTTKSKIKKLYANT